MTTQDKTRVERFFKACADYWRDSVRDPTCDPGQYKLQLCCEKHRGLAKRRIANQLEAWTLDTLYKVGGRPQLLYLNPGEKIDESKFSLETPTVMSQVWFQHLMALSHVLMTTWPDWWDASQLEKEVVEQFFHDLQTWRKQRDRDQNPDPDCDAKKFVKWECCPKHIALQNSLSILTGMANDINEVFELGGVPANITAREKATYSPEAAMVLSPFWLMLLAFVVGLPYPKDESLGI